MFQPINEIGTEDLGHFQQLVMYTCCSCTLVQRSNYDLRKAVWYMHDELISYYGQRNVALSGSEEKRLPTHVFITKTKNKKCLKPSKRIEALEQVEPDFLLNIMYGSYWTVSKTNCWIMPPSPCMKLFQKWGVHSLLHPRCTKECHHYRFLLEASNKRFCSLLIFDIFKKLFLQISHQG